VGFVLYLLITPPIYRWFRLLPLLLPRCPHCGYNKCFWTSDHQPGWPAIWRVVCDQCRKEVDLCLDDPADAPTDADPARVRLLWPQSIGRWKQLPHPAAPSRDGR
jgi:hypothetical protein